MKRQITLDELAGVPKLEITVNDAKEIVEKFEKKFGGFNPIGINKFYEKAKFAEIEWVRKMADGTTQPIPLGKVVKVIPYENTKGTKAFKNYEYTSDVPFVFWQEVFAQVNKIIARMQYAEQKKLEGYAEMEEQSNTDDTSLDDF